MTSIDPTHICSVDLIAQARAQVIVYRNVIDAPEELERVILERFTPKRDKETYAALDDIPKYRASLPRILHTLSNHGQAGSKLEEYVSILNGQNQENELHLDGDVITAILYLSEIAEGTTFYVPKNKTPTLIRKRTQSQPLSKSQYTPVFSTLPQPGTLVVFNGLLPHARADSTEFTSRKPRVRIFYQAEKK